MPLRSSRRGFACLPWSGRRTSRGAAEAVLRGLCGVEDRAAVLADGDAGLDLLAAGGAIAQAHGHVRPLALDADGHSRTAVQIRNFAERMAARPERVALG